MNCTLRTSRTSEESSTKFAKLSSIASFSFFPPPLLLLHRARPNRVLTAPFRPAFRHFFLEYFPEPAQWFERRLAYTRSVAANSIVGARASPIFFIRNPDFCVDALSGAGYIVGLGDRHSHNILIDKTTAEMGIRSGCTVVLYSRQL